MLMMLVGGDPRAAWVMPWLVLLLYIAAFQGHAVNGFVTNAWIATIGGMCYTIYLLHNYIVAELGTITERLALGSGFSVRLGVQFFVMTPVVLVLCALYFRFVERPCMRPDWPQRLKSAFLRMKPRLLLAWTER